MNDFDPYFQWLDIPPAEQPPDHYRLLGIPRFANDPGAIQSMADERMVAVRRNQAGPRGRFTQKLLNELATAKLCLLNPYSKAEYDAWLTKATGGGPPVVESLLPPPLPGELAPAAHSGGKPVVQVHATNRPAARSSGFDPRMFGWWLTMLGMPLTMVLGLSLLLVKAVANRRGTPVRESSAGDSAGGSASSGKVQEQTLAEPNRNASSKSEREIEQAVIRQEASGFVSLPMSFAKLNGQLALDSREVGNLLVGWRSDSDSATWQFRTDVRPPQGIYRVRLTYQAGSSASGTQLVLDLDGEEHLRDLHARDRFVDDECYLAVKRNGAHTLSFSLRGKPASAVFALKLLELSIPRAGG